MGKIRTVLRHPSLGGRGLNRLYHVKKGSKSYNEDGIAVLEADWDVLIILDAARYELFNQQWDGDVDSKISRGSNTAEFLRANFTDVQAHDAVYVSANPRLKQLEDELNASFHAEYHAWRDCWDNELNTVPPSELTKFTTEIADRHPKKRLIVHYIQPHLPFINGPEKFDSEFDGNTADVRQTGVRYLWFKQMLGESTFSKHLLWEAYKQNHKIVIEAARELLSSIEGRIIVTSDHGNLVGERAWPLPIHEWGHPEGIHVPELVKVPWVVARETERPDIVSDPPVETESEYSDRIDERLAALGYQ